MLDSSLDRPLYRQLTDRLRLEVARRQPGERIASEPELALTLGVSRFTVAKAIETLVDEGLVVRRQGKGTFVAVPPLHRTPGQLRGFTEAIHAAGRHATAELLRFGPTEWRPDLPYGPSETLILLERLRHVDDMPIALHRSVLSAALVAEIGLTRAIAADPRFSLYQFLEAKGLRIEHGIETLTARMPTQAEHGHLRLDADGIVMVAARRSFGADGRLLDAVEAVHDSRRYCYQARLRRAPVAGADQFSNEMGREQE
jgi:GntR family transcriptional regulator